MGPHCAAAPKAGKRNTGMEQVSLCYTAHLGFLAPDGVLAMKSSRAAAFLVVGFRMALEQDRLSGIRGTG